MGSKLTSLREVGREANVNSELLTRCNNSKYRSIEVKQDYIKSMGHLAMTTITRAG